jgi:hypothetical protein
MKFIPIFKIIFFVMAVCGFSFKTRAQQLPSQKPVSEIYSKKTQEWLAVNRNRNPNPSTLQDQRNLPSRRPWPRQATEYKMKHPQVALNAALPDNEKIKMLPSNTHFTVNQIAARAAARKPPRPKAITMR